jgi:methyltransferase
VTLATLLLALVTLQRLGELVISRHNTRRLLAQGAIEVAPGHYPFVVMIHAVWLITLWIWGRDQDVNLAALSIFNHHRHFTSRKRQRHQRLAICRFAES